MKKRRVAKCVDCNNYFDACRCLDSSADYQLWYRRQVKRQLHREDPELHKRRSDAVSRSKKGIPQPNHPLSILSKSRLAKDGFKICSKCNKKLPVELFKSASDREHLDGLRPACNDCDRPLKIKQQLRNRLRAHGMTEQEFTDMFRTQKGHCAICKMVWLSVLVGSIYIDHDHDCCEEATLANPSCGLCNRGLLCRKCNFGLENFRDNPAFLRVAADYLESSKLALRRVSGGCLDCRCYLPSNSHGNEDHITWQDYQKGDRDYSAAAAANDKSIPWVRASIKMTLDKIDSKKISPNKRK